jgi:hypothetical protein
MDSILVSFENSLRGLFMSSSFPYVFICLSFVRLCPNLLSCGHWSYLFKACFKSFILIYLALNVPSSNTHIF